MRETDLALERVQDPGVMSCADESPGPEHERDLHGRQVLLVGLTRTEHYRRPAGGYRLVVCLERQRAFRQGLGHRPTERNETVATLAVYRTEEVGQSLDFAEWLLGVVVEKTGGVTIAPEHERPVVELSLSAEPLGQPASPGALLAGRPVIQAWNYLLEPSEGSETGRLGEPCADEDVLVGERQHGAAVEIVHRCTKSGSGAAAPAEGGNADQQAWRATDPLEGCRARTREAFPARGPG